MKMICPKHKECKDYCKAHSKPHDEKTACPNTSTHRKTYTSVHDCPPCIPYVREFKVGDRVRVLKEKANASGFHLGEVCKIEKVRKSQGDYRLYSILRPSQSWLVRTKNLKLIEEGDMDKPKYKVTKSVSLASIYDGVVKSDCQEVFDHFSNLLWFLKESHFGNIINPAKLIEWAEQDPKRIKWLIEHGYFEEVQSAYDKWLDECPCHDPTQDPHAKMINYVKWAKRMPKED